MRLVLLAGLILTFAAPPAAPADDLPATPLGRKLAKLKTKFEADRKELQKKLAAAKGQEERQQVTFLFKELHALTASDAVDLAEDGKRDEDGMAAAVFALRLLGEHRITGSDMDKAAAILTQHHIDNPKIAPALEHMAEAGPTGEAFLDAVAEKAMNGEVQALAMYYQAVALDLKAAAAEGPRGDEAKIAAVRARAADMMEKAAKQAPDARVGGRTLAQAVAADLVSLRIAPGASAPDVEGTAVDGKKAKLSDYRGKVVLFDFWATWCGPCRGMIPHERELSAKLKGKPFALLSVSIDDEKETVTDFLGTEKMPWDHWWDGARGPVAKTYRVRSYPTLFLIDAKGVVRKKWVGAPEDEALTKAVEELVAEAEKR